MSQFGSSCQSFVAPCSALLSTGSPPLDSQFGWLLIQYRELSNSKQHLSMLKSYVHRVKFGNSQFGNWNNENTKYCFYPCMHTLLSGVSGIEGVLRAWSCISSGGKLHCDTNKLTVFIRCDDPITVMIISKSFPGSCSIPSSCIPAFTGTPWPNQPATTNGQVGGVTSHVTQTGRHGQAFR